MFVDYIARDIFKSIISVGGGDEVSRNVSLASYFTANGDFTKSLHHSEAS